MNTVDFKEQEFLMEESDIMDQYDELNFRNNLEYYKEGVEQMLSVVISSDGENKVDMISQTMETFRSTASDYKMLVEFFEGIHESPKLDDIPITTKVYNMSAIERIRPQYLTQISTDIGLTIDKILKGTISKGEVDNIYLSDQYLTNCKKQMVRTSIPHNLDPKNLLKYDCGVIVDVNGEFMDNNILPFLRNIPQCLKELEITSGNAISAIRSGYDEIQVYANVIDKMLKNDEINISTYRYLNKYLYKAIRTFMSAASYLTFIMMKKISLAIKNVAAYDELRIKILNYFPEGDGVLHEHVMDGSFHDIDEAGLVHNILLNDNSTFRSIIQSIVGRERSDLAHASGPIVGDDHHSMIDVKIQENPYKDTIYRNTIAVFNQLLGSFNTIRVNAKDPIIAFDDIIDKAELRDPLTSRYTTIVNDISSLKDYEFLINTNLSREDKERLYYTILHELSDGVTWMDRIVATIYNTYENYLELEEDLQQGDTLVFKNPETVKELQKFLDDFDADFRHLVLSVVTAYLSRFKELNYILNDIEKELFQNLSTDQLKIESDQNEFEYLAFDGYMENTEADNQILFESLMRDYYSERVFYETGMRVVFEDGLATSAGATNNAQNNQNSGNNRSNTSGGAKTIGQQIDGIITMVKNFFKKSRDAMQEIITKQSGNLEWLQNNREALLNRSFTGITFNVLPYEKYVTTQQILSDIDSLGRNIDNLNKDNIKKYSTIKNLNSYLFNFMSNGMGNTDKVGETTLKYYKVKNAPMEVMPYKGGQAKALMPVMVDYCISFYSSFNNDLMKKLNDLERKTTDALTRMESVNESVLFEADGDNQQQTNQNNQNTQKPNTKPTVQMDKKTDSSARDINGKKVETDSTYQIIKWLNRSIQEYSSFLLTAVRDRNYDYLKIIQAVAPKDIKNNNGNQNNEQQQNQNTSNNQEQNQ